MQFRSQAQEFAAHAHNGRTDGIQQPPRGVRREHRIVPPANAQMHNVKGAAARMRFRCRLGCMCLAQASTFRLLPKVQAQFRPSHDEPQRQRADKRVERERCDDQTAAQIGDVDFL